MAKADISETIKKLTTGTGHHDPAALAELDNLTVKELREHAQQHAGGVNATSQRASIASVIVLIIFG